MRVGVRQPATPQGHVVSPQEIAGPHSRPYQGTPMVNSPLIRPYFLGGWHWGGVPLVSHDIHTSSVPYSS